MPYVKCSGCGKEYYSASRETAMTPCQECGKAVYEITNFTKKGDSENGKDKSRTAGRD